ncbi:hypothetical protein AAF712_013777 [Marasmius tenuissimus]|uniref:Uncharacterized protein n=1 Tax=Marasmius tenuissimus TaxID=585030 RepID=A0ABR2ZER0_9AGAR|nr:hypothetical protein PM082_013796 [Marasmius tenuissimus]
MVRPRKYKTKAEQQKAVLEKSKRSYNKHRVEILARRQNQRREHKQRQDQALVKDLLGSIHRRSTKDLDKTEEKRAHRFFESLHDVYCAEISKAFTTSPLEFYELLCKRTISWLDRGSAGDSPFSQLESQIQRLNTNVTLHADKIYNLFGDKDLYQRFMRLRELVREHMACIDELEYGRLVDGLVGEEQLYEKYKEGRCAYQTPSRVPLISGRKLLL